MDDVTKRIAGLSPEKRALLEKRLRAANGTSGAQTAEPIAIIGMSCRFPGGADTPEIFWELLKNGFDAVGEVPADRWDSAALYDRDPSAAEKMTTRWGAFLDRLDRFDAAFFGISPREAAQMDPQQRLLLEVASEALEEGGLALERLAGSRTGVFIGVHSLSSDYCWLQLSNRSRIDTYTSTGTAHSIIPNRLSYLFDLQGPSLAVDTACSSSLVAVHLACQSLRSKECNLVIAGGVNLILSPEMTIAFSKLGMMASDGRCKVFDSRADGFVRGEGCGVVVLKRLADAQADGDPILAVVRGTAVNQDGRTNGLTAPNGLSQQAVVRQALENGGVDPREIDYIEAHGTGTALGDPIEVEALAAVLGERSQDRYCALGSVKTNIGHLEAAAGIAGLIKVVLAMQNETIPPHLHFSAINPHIALEKTPFKIFRAGVPWPKDAGRTRYAGVSSFGFGGTNAHVVLEESPRPADETRHENDGYDPVCLLPISARSAGALQSLAASYGKFLATEEPGTASLRDICYGAGARRTHHDFRIFLTGRSRGEMARHLRRAFHEDDHFTFSARCKPDDRERGVAFVFSGQGAQWFGMGRELLAEEPVFRAALEKCDMLLRQHSSWSLLQELAADESHSRFDQTEIAQPAIFALQVGLAELWRSWGIVPDLLIGHSVGEVAAAYVSGALRLENAVQVIYHRGRLMQRGTGKGKMASVELSEAEARDLLVKYDGRLAIAAVNGPHTTVLSGERDALMEVLHVLETRKVSSQLLSVNYAFHSRQMEPYQDDLVRALEGLKAGEPLIPMISTVTGKTVEDGQLDAIYWGRNIREPVRFADAVYTAFSDDVNACAFLEISPHPVLAASIAQCASHRDRKVSGLCSLRRGHEERLTMLTALGELYCDGRNIDWGLLYRQGGTVVKLPSYPWQRERYWLDERTTPVSTKKFPLSPGQSGARQAAPPAKLNDWLYKIIWEPKPRRDQTEMIERLSYLPAPTDIVTGLRGQVDKLGAQNDLPQFRAVSPHLENLSVMYTLQALQRLGWDGRPVAAGALAERLNIIERHTSFFACLLAILEEAGMVERVDDRVKLRGAIKREDPKRRSEELLRQYPGCRVEVELLSRCGEQLADVLVGRADPLELLFPGNGASAENLYDGAPFMKTANALVRRALELGLKNLPEKQTVRILEIGAGTGGTTKHILSCLPRERTQYVFTDISNSFLIAAAQKFSSYPFIEYRLLDLERDPRSQGFEAGAFDIVIAANVLHATADLSRTLHHVKELLAPRGLLALVEGTGPQQWLDLIFGMVEGWWKFTDKNLRPKHTLISQSEWTGLLEQVGFEHSATFPHENEGVLVCQSVILARAPCAVPAAEAAFEWLIFADRSGLASRLEQLLSNRGERYILVSAGADFQCVDSQHFEINPANPDDFERVWMELRGRKPNSKYRVVHVWSLDMTPLDKSTAEQLEAEQVSTCGSIIHLVRVLAKQAVNGSLWLVSRGAQPVVAPQEALAVTQSTIWGLGRVIALEHPEFWGGLIDLEEGADLAAQVSQLWQEIRDDDRDAEDQIGFRDKLRFVPRLVRYVPDSGESESLSDRPTAKGALFVPEGGYLITGGLGKLGLRVALWMAQRGARYLALVSRRQLPERSNWAELSAKDDGYEAVRQIQSIESLGATVRLVSGDVGDFDTMRALFAEFGDTLPPLRGVIHAAGVIDFHPLTSMDANVLRAGLRPKVVGAWALHELTKSKSLDFFAAFSSGASVWSAKGLAHYAAANQFLDCLAYHRRAIGLPALTVNWGWWAGGGTSVEWEKYFAQVGLEPMPAADALEIFGYVLQCRATQVTAAACNWSLMRPIYEAKRRRRFLDRLAPEQTAVQNRPSETKESFVNRLRRTASSERQQFLRDHVAQEVAKVLGVEHPGALDPHQGFFRMGMDSLMSVQLRQRLENILDSRPLPLTLAFEYPNIEALTKYLASEVLDLVSPSSRTRVSVKEAGAARPDPHDRLSEDELIDLLAKKMEELE